MSKISKFEIELLEEVVSFILNQSEKMQAKIQRSIQLLKEFGFSLKEPYCKKLNDGIYELRVKCGSDICRLFYFYFKDRIYVVTSGYVKKTQKLNKNEFQKAFNLKQHFLEQHK